MEQSYKKRPPRATANSPLVLADMGGGKLFYKSGKFSYISKVHTVIFCKPMIYIPTCFY